MTSTHTARRLALELPGATEQDHHGSPSFRVRGRIFATLPATDKLRVMLDEPGIRTAATEHPDVCAEIYWGKRLACLEIDVPRADTELVRELLADAWEHKSGRPRRKPPAQ